MGWRISVGLSKSNRRLKPRGIDLSKQWTDFLHFILFLALLCLINLFLNLCNIFRKNDARFERFINSKFFIIVNVCRIIVTLIRILSLLLFVYKDSISILHYLLCLLKSVSFICKIDVLTDVFFVSKSHILTPEVFDCLREITHIIFVCDFHIFFQVFSFLKVRSLSYVLTYVLFVFNIFKRDFGFDIRISIGTTLWLIFTWDDRVCNVQLGDSYSLVRVFIIIRTIKPCYRYHTRILWLWIIDLGHGLLGKENVAEIIFLTIIVFSSRLHQLFWR